MKSELCVFASTKGQLLVHKTAQARSAAQVKITEQPNIRFTLTGALSDITLTKNIEAFPTIYCTEAQMHYYKN